jgi:cysteine synthase
LAARARIRRPRRRHQAAIEVIGRQGAFLLNQFFSDENVVAQCKAPAPDRRRGRVDVFIGMGTGGQRAGAA